MGSVYLFLTVGGMFEWDYLALGAMVSFVMIQAAARVGGMVYSEEQPAAGASI